MKREPGTRTRVLAVLSLMAFTSLFSSCSNTGLHSPDSSPVGNHANQAKRPNILIILSDDQGYADGGFMGCKDIPTPNLDRLANEGLRFTNGYVTHAYCSPSRAGLMTGRYQMRFGYEYNPEYSLDNHGQGVSLTEKLLPQYLQEAGYVTGWIGKWHLGAAPEFRPENRGFRETFGFLGGGHNFIDPQLDPEKKFGSGYDSEEYNSPILRNGKPEDIKEHLTIAFGREAAAFIKRHNSGPWFLYLAFNAPHMPNQPTPERLERFRDIKNIMRRKYAAQVSLMDDAIGEALKAVRETGQTDNTLVFFFSDNGGQIYNGADNTPLRGYKGTTFEGGVRVPFLVSWPKHIPAGYDYNQTVSSLDVFATSLACAGISLPVDRPYDGVNLIPYLRGDKKGNPRERLFWREPEAGQWGVRDGDWKLVWRTIDWRRPGGKNMVFPEPSVQLFNLTDDISEKLEFSIAHPETVLRLKKLIDDWESSSFSPPVRQK